MENKRFRKCTICGIQQLPKSGTLFASFPIDPDRCRLWVKASGIEDLVHVPIEKLHENKFICGAHFTGECFNRKRNRLLNSAVPTENLTRPLLCDDLLTKFPLHVKSYYEKKSGELIDSSKLAVKTITVLDEKKDTTIKGESVSSTDRGPCSVNDIISITSTSKAPSHLTHKITEGISEKTVSKITKEGEVAASTSTKISTPGKHEKKVKLDDFELCALRHKIHEFYVVKKELPTLTNLLHEMRKEIYFKGSRTTLWRIMKKLGFYFQKCKSKRKILMERYDIVAWLVMCR